MALRSVQSRLSPDCWRCRGLRIPSRACGKVACNESRKMQGKQEGNPNMIDLRRFRQRPPIHHSELPAGLAQHHPALGRPREGWRQSAMARRGPCVARKSRDVEHFFEKNKPNKLLKTRASCPESDKTNPILDTFRPLRGLDDSYPPFCICHSAGEAATKSRFLSRMLDRNDRFKTFAPREDDGG